LIEKIFIWEDESLLQGELYTSKKRPKSQLLKTSQATGIERRQWITKAFATLAVFCSLIIVFKGYGIQKRGMDFYLRPFPFSEY